MSNADDKGKVKKGGGFIRLFIQWLQTVADDRLTLTLE